MELVKMIREQWDRALGWVAIGLGGLALILGWLGVSRYGFPASQLPYIISGGIGGVILVGVGAVLLLSADIQDEWRKLDIIDEKLERLLARQDSSGLASQQER
jgi:hypothetical protein